MSTIFVGGSRHVTRLPELAKERLDNAIASGFSIIVGDANGADKAIQKHLADRAYNNVTVFCSGNTCRNNLGDWYTSNIKTKSTKKDFQFFATKDREMALKADFGLMIWDGKSPGTVLNVLRLLRAEKKVVLFNATENHATTFKGITDWDKFLSKCNAKLIDDLKQRATSEEWENSSAKQSSFLDETPNSLGSKTHENMEAEINAALAAHDPKSAVDILGTIARAKGMSQIAKDTGFARESLYRTLSSEGNPEFATVLKVMNSLGLTLTVHKAA